MLTDQQKDALRAKITAAMKTYHEVEAWAPVVRLLTDVNSETYRLYKAAQRRATAAYDDLMAEINRL